MEAQLTLTVWNNLISYIPLFVAFLLAVKQYKKYPLRHNLYFTFSWFCLSAWGIMTFFGEVFFSISVKKIGTYFIILAGFGIIRLLDSVAREQIEPIKLSIMIILSTLLVVSSMEPEAVSIGMRNGEQSLITGGWFRVCGSLLILFEGIVILIYWTRIHLAAPRLLRKYSRILFLSGFLIGIITPILYILKMSIFASELINFIFTLGTLLSTWAFVKCPQLACILPFKVLRLVVIDLKTGLSLFSYDWTKKPQGVDDILFSGMIYGITGILNEGVQKGNVKEIMLENGQLLVERNEKVSIGFILETTKSNIELRNALQRFNAKFVNQFRNDFNKTHCISIFDSAKGLVEECFPFVPSYE